MKTEIKFCIKCLYGSTHPLGLTFNEKNICSGCLIHEEKNTLDWQHQWTKLLKLTNEYKSKSKNIYDCIIPITGAHDSHYIVYIVKEKLKLNPLLVCYNKYYNTSIGIKNISNLRIKFNCDILFQNVNPISVKKITRNTLIDFGSVYWHVLAGHTVFPVQISIKYKIPLIIWGAHQGLEQVGMYSHLNEVEMTRRYRKDHDLLGIEAENLVKQYNNLNEGDIFQYLYPEDLDLKKNGTRGIYLGNYIRWDPKKQHEEMIRLYDYKTSGFNRTIDCYDYVDCFNYMNLHDLLKLYKHGYSKITDHLSREIRFGRIDKNRALKLARFYEKKNILYKELFCNWLNINKKSLDFILNKFRNKKFWIQRDVDSWTFNGLSKKNFIQKNLESKKISKKLFFISNSEIKKDKKNYIIYGKGMEL
jgi:N-acetyl sugar amidotransferase